ncbi:hypothetical protein [Euhalothece natronophila]|uniref:hypothetical protein n=1 Tax=Euhalothece natronophila TaxID=577489 RepID=UPI0016487841|nr:hypothetical protein [Euhalothece natronophila]
MKIMKIIDNINSFFAEAIARIFSPSDDAYPNVGVQPYSGDPVEGEVEFKW